MNVVILWHMHQPYYVNPLTKKAMMPWVRLHAARGYLDMIDLVTARPEIRVTFNFSPVLVRQILELVSGQVQDEWENLSRKPAADLDDQDKRHLLENFFKINWDTLVRPVPRYAELLAKRGANYTLANLDSIARKFTDADFRETCRPSTTFSGAASPPRGGSRCCASFTPRAATSAKRRKTRSSTSTTRFWRWFSANTAPRRTGVRSS